MYKEINLVTYFEAMRPLNGYTQHYVFIPSDITDNSSNSLASDYGQLYDLGSFDNNQGAGYQPGAYDQRQFSLRSLVE